MSLSRLTLPVFIALMLTALAGCGAQDPGHDARVLSQSERIDQALAHAGQFLLGRQAADGSWRSEIYGPFKDGTALTPFVAHALQATPSTAERDAACRRGIAYLAQFVQADGTIDPGPYGLRYPVYTAAGAIRLLSTEDGTFERTNRAAWITYLRKRQLTEDLGWQAGDKEYGGWGYCPTLPRKPPDGELVPPLTESNLSATLSALAALRAAGVSTTDPAVTRARVFIERCQNFGDNPAFDDGGFFFIYDDGARNKAGVAGHDAQGRERYASYGSTSADGLQALLLCGLPLDHPRMAAARRWLETHFDAGTHPGNFRPEREPNRPSVYYYFACSLAEGFRAVALKEVDTPAGKQPWANALAEELLKRQREDGSWVNPAVQVREDDPLVATALAVRALAICREGL